MKAYVCDACGKTVKPVIKIEAKVKHTSAGFVPPCQPGTISGDYCLDCGNKIISFMYGLKGEEESLEAKIFRAEKDSKS